MTIKLRKLILSALAILVCISLPGSVLAGNSNDERIKKAIVNIFAVSTEPGYYSPWIMDSPRQSSGSGCIIGGGRILTNAHVVADSTFIQVQPYGSSERYNARVLHVSHETDLALLEVEDKSFLKGIKPLKFGGLPEVLEEVLAYGFPLGGDAMSITKGIISRVEYQEYSHSGYYFLAGQIDAAINPGNSGGPVIQDGEVVGIVMQTYNSEDAENIGYMIPTSVINHFLEDLKDGSYDGFPELGFFVQSMESPALKEMYKVPEDTTGVLINYVAWNSPASEHVRVGDVMLAIDGHEVADDGTVAFRQNERVVFGYYIDIHQIGDVVDLTLLRDGQVLEIAYSVTQRGADLFIVPPMAYDTKARYFIFGGVVITPLTKNLMCEWKNCKAPKELLAELGVRPSAERREAVVAVQVLPANVNRGYHDLRGWVFHKVDGKSFRDFDELYEMVFSSKSKYLVLENRKGYRVVIDREEAAATHSDVLATYNVTEDRSEDLRIR